jgi:hypothetical protein
MSHVLLVAGALIFEADWDQVGSGFVPDRLAHRLTRAQQTWQPLETQWSDGAADLQWLARAFAVPGDPPPCAAYSWRAAGGQHGANTAGDDIWFCEPVHLSLQPERTVLAPIDTPPLNAQEADELFEEAADSARNQGTTLRQAAGRWYLFPAEAWDLRTTPLPAALGASVEARLPQGKHASQWRRLLTEVQMRWHASRINREREARRQQAANGLWLHGGGAWRRLDASRFGRVDTQDPVVLGWQQAGRPASAGRAPPDSLTVWPHLFEPYWRRDWRAWAAGWAQLDAAVESLLQAVGSGGNGPLELVACGRRAAASFILDRSSAWLPWRRRALRDCLLEATR